MDISVIIPIFNVAEYIKACLDSVQKNVKKMDAEVILIDDGSTDESSEIARTYADSHEKFFYFRKENGGVGSARNAGVERAKGEYILFVDPDDLVVEGIWEKMLQSARRFQTDLTICDVAKLQNGKVVGSDLHLYAFYNMKGVVTHVRQHPNLVFDSMVWNKLIRRDYYQANGFSFPTDTWFEDIPVAMRLHYLANKVAVVHETGYLWRVRNHSITRSFNQKGVRDKLNMLNQLFVYVDQNVPEHEIREALEKKAVKMDFTSYINHFVEMDPAEASGFLEQIAAFIETHVSEKVLNSLPLMQRQAFAYVLDRDIKRLNQLTCYKMGNDSAMPVCLTDNGPEFKVREEYFTVSGRSIENYFADVSPRCMVDSVEIEENTLRLIGHLYMRRVNVLPGEQMISAYLLDDISGSMIELPAEASTMEELTAEQGSILNHDDYTFYHYCYDGAGFVIDIDLDEILKKQEKEGEYFIFLRYANPVFRGERIIRSIRKAGKDVLNGVQFEKDGYKGTVTFDKRETIIIRIKPVPQESKPQTEEKKKNWRDRVKRRNR